MESQIEERNKKKAKTLSLCRLLLLSQSYLHLTIEYSVVFDYYSLCWCFIVVALLSFFLLVGLIYISVHVRFTIQSNTLSSFFSAVWAARPYKLNTQKFSCFIFTTQVISCTLFFYLLNSSKSNCRALGPTTEEREGRFE